jgi:hypothetical protein
LHLVRDGLGLVFDGVVQWARERAWLRAGFRVYGLTGALLVGVVAVDVVIGQVMTVLAEADTMQHR